MRDLEFSEVFERGYGSGLLNCGVLSFALAKRICMGGRCWFGAAVGRTWLGRLSKSR